MTGFFRSSYEGELKEARELPHARTLPEPRGPALFSLFRFGQDPLGAPGRFFLECGDTFQSRLFGQTVIMTRDPEWIQEVLVTQARNFNKDRTTKGLSVLLGQGLLTSDGEEWRRNRRALQPHFHPQEVEQHLALFAEEAQVAMADWPARGLINVHEVLTRLTMRVVLRTLFGADPAHGHGFESIMAAAMEYFEGVFGTQTPLPLSIPTSVNRRFLAARKELRSRFASIVESAARSGKEDTFLAQLMRSRESEDLTREQFVDECITMLVAGHETSALALSYSLYLLSCHPLSERRLYEELLSKGVPETIRDCQRPGVLKNTLTETLRLYPVAWAVAREALSDLHIAGTLVKKGTQVCVHQWQAHRHPRYFQEPERFLPERWSEVSSAALPKNLYAPFGAGPRICIGNHFALAEMTVVLAHMVQAFEFTRDSTAPLELRASITARPRHPLFLRARCRSEV